VTEAKVRRTPPAGELPQRKLMLELRYAIDLVMKLPTDERMKAVRKLIEDNPHGFNSHHVQYNLGVARMDFLRRNGIGGE
jgi:hypothetical protein